MRDHEDGCNVHPVNYAEGVKLFLRRRSASGVCRKGGKEKIVELGMVRHDCGDRFGKCDSNLSFELDMV